MKSCAGTALGGVSLLCAFFNCLLVTSAQDESPRRVREIRAMVTVRVEALLRELGIAPSLLA